MHTYNEINKCLYCGSTRQMIEKFNWKCSDEKIPQDRIVNERVYSEIGIKDAIIKLSKEIEPWKRIVYKVYHAESGLLGLDQNEHDYYVMNTLYGDVYNGGLEQYFGNSSGNLYSALMAVLKEYGHNKLKIRIEEIAKSIFGDADIDSQEIRAEILYGGSSKSDDPIWEEFKLEELASLDSDMDRLYNAMASKNGYKCT